MRKITLVLVILVAALTVSAYAAAKSYQFTGVVKTVQGDTFTVQKSASETWEFSKVTVHYKMIATEIETSAAPAAKPKK